MRNSTLPPNFPLNSWLGTFCPKVQDNSDSVFTNMWFLLTVQKPGYEQKHDLFGLIESRALAF